jgi:CHAT domain-containing protein
LKDTSNSFAEFYDPYLKLARLYNENYKPDSAILIIDEGISFCRQESKTYSKLLYVLLSSHYLIGDMDGVKKVNKRIYDLEIGDEREKTSAMLVQFLFYSKIGEYDEAAKWLDEYAKSASRTYVKNPYLGKVIPGLVKGKHYTRLGEYDKALQCVDASISILQKIRGHTETLVDSESDLLRIQEDLGQYDKSLAAKLKTHRAIVSTTFENSPNRIYSLSQLGFTYQTLGQLDSARFYYQQALDILKKVDGKKTSNYISILDKLGQVAEKLHDYAIAEKQYLEAVNTCDSVEIITPQDKGLYLSNLSKILRKRAKYPESLEKSEKSLAILRGPQITDAYRKAQLNRALLHDVQQQNTAAVDSLQSLFGNIQTRIVKEFAYLSEQDKVAFMTMLDNDFFGTMQAAYARLYAKGEAAKSGALFYNTVLMQKELSLVDTRSLKRKAANDTAILAKLFTLTTFEEHLKSDKPFSAAEREQMSVECRQIRADLERNHKELFEKDWLGINWQSVKKTLKKGEIAIEFADVLNNDDDTTTIRNYYALAITADSDYPSVLPLFEEKELIKLLDESRVYETDPKTNVKKVADAATVEKRYDADFGKKLYNLIWKPIENAQILRGVQTVHFAPSGLLNRVSFGALPVGNDLEKLLIDRYQLRQYNSTRALVDKPRDTATMSKDMLVMGNINYGNCDGDTSKRAQIEPIQPDKGQYATARSAIFLDSIKRHWQYLPNSKPEMDGIEQSHKTLQPTAKLNLFTGFAADEARFKSYGSYGKPSPPIIYISTHGYGNPTNYPESRYASAALHRAGLVMATANWTTECPITRLPDEEDEILTAYEIAQLNLSNTELVVLSGCQTGLGDIWGREGVFGLTRGFKLAGVNHIIASLWEVNDAQTAEFMTAFYNAYLSGKSINTAFEETKKAMREKQPASSWAAWVLIR